MSQDDDLQRKAEEFLALFRKGADFTKELLRDNERLRRHLVTLEDRQNSAAQSDTEWAKLRSELLGRIQSLEEEKQDVLERLRTVEEENRQFASRYLEVEEENNNLANLYISSFQLHSTLNLAEVLKIIVEIVINLRIGDGIVGEAVGSGETFCSDPSAAPDPRKPIVCIPLRLEDRPIGAIAIYALLQQKEGFTPLDHELFTLLGGHAATGIFAAQLYGLSERKLNTIQGFIDLLTK